MRWQGWAARPLLVVCASGPSIQPLTSARESKEVAGASLCRGRAQQHADDSGRQPTSRHPTPTPLVHRHSHHLPLLLCTYRHHASAALTTQTIPSQSPSVLGLALRLVDGFDGRHLAADLHEPRAALPLRRVQRLAPAPAQTPAPTAAARPSAPTTASPAPAGASAVVSDDGEDGDGRP